LRLYAVKTRLIVTGDDLVQVVLGSLKEQRLQLEDCDVLALTSKILSYAQGRVVKLGTVKPSEKARELARHYLLAPEFAELILRESDKIYGGVEKAILTFKTGILTANAGIDNKNAPPDSVVLWPEDVTTWAKRLKDEIRRRTGKQIAVLIVDSGLTPLRIGTIGLALAVAGFNPIRDHREKEDLYGKKVTITRHAVADDLACAAHLLMGESAERIPAVLIKEAPVDFNDGVYGSSDMMMPHKECIFMKVFG
jgi:coenzyme F420-0:L-glutamate ligase/coenzyme F420-1:gamma-L-glutamate ligase